MAEARVIKYIRLNDGLLYQLLPADHMHKLADIEDFTLDLSQYDNSKAKFVSADEFATKQNKVLSGTVEPSEEIGVDGDIYFMLEE